MRMKTQPLPSPLTFVPLLVSSHCIYSVDLSLLEWLTLDHGLGVGLGHVLHIMRPWFMRQAPSTQVGSWLKDSSRPVGILMGALGFYELTRVIAVKVKWFKQKKSGRLLGTSPLGLEASSSSHIESF